MFIGEYHHTIDGKGRLALPTKFRRVLSKGVVITRGVDQCLFVYARGTWQALAANMALLPLNQKNTRAFARLMLAGAMDGAPDSQGRIIVPEYLRTYARLKKRVVIAGVYDRFEIWDEQLWRTYTTAAERQSESIAETIGSLSAST